MMLNIDKVDGKTKVRNEDEMRRGMKRKIREGMKGGMKKEFITIISTGCYRGIR